MKMFGLCPKRLHAGHECGAGCPALNISVPDGQFDIAVTLHSPALHDANGEAEVAMAVGPISGIVMIPIEHAEAALDVLAGAIKEANARRRQL